MPKLDSEGKYLPFHGFSAVCMVEDRISKFSEILSFIKNSSLGKRFSPLPASSMHMTVSDMFTERDFDNCVEKMLETSFKNCNEIFHNIIVYLRENIIQPKIKVVKLHSERTCTIELKLETNDNIDDFRSKVARTFRLNKNGYVFHITLGYMYSEQEINQEDVQILTKMVQNLKLELEECSLVYFNSMQKFIKMS